MMNERAKIHLQKTTRIISNKKFIVAVIFFLASIWSFPIIIQELNSGLDASWTIGLHLAKIKNLVWGTDFVWSYGPLGYLIYPMPIDNELYKQTVLYGIFSHSLFFITMFFFVIKTNQPIKNSLILGFFSIFFMYIDWVYFPWIGILLGFYLYIQYSKNKFYLIPLVFSVAFLTFTKIDMGLGSTSILVLSSVYLAIKGRYKETAFCLILYSIFLILIWLGVSNSLESFPSYITNSLDLASGYALTHSIQNLSFYAFFMILPPLILGIFWIFEFNKNNKQNLKFFFISSVSLFFFFKEGFVRFDGGHFQIFLYLIPVIFLIITMINKGKSNKILLFSTYGLIIFYSLSALYITSDSELFHIIENPSFTDVVSNASNWLDFRYSGAFAFSQLQFAFSLNDEHIDNVIEQQKQKLKTIVPPLSQKTLRLLGNNTVDVIPWNIDVAYAYDLNLKPRPVTATMDYTANTDKLNQQFMKSDSAPNNILYEKKIYDNHYPLFEEPSTLRTLLCNYHIVGVDGKRYIFEKNENNICYKEEIISEQTVNFEQLILIPPNEEGYLFAKINIEQNSLGKIFNFFYKPPQVHIQINEQIVKRFVFPTAQNGILLNFNSESKQNCSLIDNIESLKLTTKNNSFPLSYLGPNNFFEEKIKIQFLEVKINKVDPEMRIFC